MLYVADGPSDIPVFSILNKHGGRTLGVYNPADERHFREVKRLRDQGRVQHFAEADYRNGSAAARWIMATLEEMADVIAADRQRAVTERVSPGARHVSGSANGARRGAPETAPAESATTDPCPDSPSGRDAHSDESGGEDQRDDGHHLDEDVHGRA